jgi:acylphosphatase
MTARRYLVSGVVQGVGYRYFVLRIARRLGVRGYVRNLPDGRVEVYAEGTPEQLDQLRAYLREGPPAAVVEGIEETEVQPSGRWDSFEVVY